MNERKKDRKKERKRKEKANESTKMTENLFSQRPNDRKCFYHYQNTVYEQIDADRKQQWNQYGRAKLGHALSAITTVPRTGSGIVGDALNTRNEFHLEPEVIFSMAFESSSCL